MKKLFNHILISILVYRMKMCDNHIQRAFNCSNLCLGEFNSNCKVRRISTFILLLVLIFTLCLII